MGYSARYHAVSMIAIFLALAIGILIGAALGGDTLTDTRRNLENSLRGNLQDARDRADELNGQLGRANQFADRVYPVLARNQLHGKRIGIVALGDLPGDVTDRVEEALGPTGARLVGVGVVREPVDLAALGGDLSRTRFADIRDNPDNQTAFGTGVGRQIVVGGDLLDRVRSHLFVRASGNFGGLDGVIIVRRQPGDMGPVQRAAAARLESALVAGIEATRAPAVGVERSRDEISSVSFFQSNGLSSVDDLDLPSGQLATVFALLGAEGSFGSKGSADRLLPDLLAPRRDR